jgi:hypothetical protein
VTSRTGSRRALVVVLAALVVLLAVADLLAPGSVLRGAWHRLTGPPETPTEELLHKERGAPLRDGR